MSSEPGSPRPTVTIRPSALAGLAALVLACGAAYGAGGNVAGNVKVATLIEDQGFEGAFPPPDWYVQDNMTPPGQYVWARTTCTAPSGGGSASVWSVGGGTAGGGLACGGTYAGPSESDLMFGPIDTRPFENGLQVATYFKLDLHRETDFQVCVTNPGSPGGIDCFSVGALQIDWNYFEPKLQFPLVGGQEEAFVVFRFRDRDFETPHQGAFVDRVVIHGLSDAPPPTTTGAATTAAPTATPSPTASATHTASPSPSATRTGTPVPTAATATAGPTGSPTGAPSGTPTATRTPTGTGAPPSATPTRTGSPPATPPTSVVTPDRRTATATATATGTFVLPPPPTVVGTVTDAPTATLEPTSTVGPTTATPSTSTATPTVLVTPEHRIYLPYAVLRRSP